MINLITAKQYLKQAYRLNGLINSDLQELEQLKALSESISSPKLSDLPSGSKQQDASFVNVVIKIVELEKLIDAEVNRLVDLKKEIREVINNVEDNNQKLVLKLRYLQYLKWDAVAIEMNLSSKQVHRIHKEALEAVKLPFGMK